MSWEAWSFVVLGAVLLGGFAWYERSRPPSQVVALVAALAALAIAGRLAFAAIPNVVATTDIVIFSGYAVGPAPGFAVGALAGLVSNFWLGQGPWTPWQMAGWGLCGVLGALLAWRGARFGRVGLAIACGFAGVAFGGLMNFSLMASYGGELTLDRFAALEVRAIPFDAAHAIGNITLALIAGPAMIRMLVRFKERFEWRRLSGGFASMLLLALAVGALSAPLARAAGRADAVSWLAGAQNRDGGFSSTRGEDSSVSITGWAMLGLEAAGRNPLDLERRRKDPGRVPAPQLWGDRKQRRPGKDDPRPPGRRARPPPLSRAQPGRRAAPEAAAQRLLRRLAQRHRLRGARPAGRRCAERPAGAHARLAAPGPEPRRWLGRRARLAQRPRLDRSGAAGGRRAPQRPQGDPLPAAGSGRRRRFPPRWLGCGQLTVDRLGGSGNAGGRGSATPHPRGWPRRLRLPCRAPIERRPLPLLEAQQPDPDLGNRPSPCPALRKDLPPESGPKKSNLKEPTPRPSRAPRAPIDHRRSHLHREPPRPRLRRSSPLGPLARAGSAPLPAALSIREPTGPTETGRLPRAKCAAGRGPAPPRASRPNRRR